MQLYSDTLLNELAGKKAVADSILSQMASGPSRQILHHINTLYDAVGSPVQDRWSESLRSTDNRKFFQGFGEAISAAFMARAGWRIADVCSPRPCLVLEHPDGRVLRIVTLAFLKNPPRQEDAGSQSDPRAGREPCRLGQAHHHPGTQVDPHAFDPEPVRRCVDIWLDAIRKGEWSVAVRPTKMTTSSLSFGERTTPSAVGTARCPSCSHPQTAFTPWTSWSRAWCTRFDNIIGQAQGRASFILSLVTNTTSLPPGLVRSLFLWTTHLDRGGWHARPPTVWVPNRGRARPVPGGTVHGARARSSSTSLRDVARAGGPTPIPGPAVRFNPRMSRAQSSRRNAKKRKTASASCAGLSRARARRQARMKFSPRTPRSCSSVHPAWPVLSIGRGPLMHPRDPSVF